MIPETIKNLIIALTDKTISKKAIWNKTSGENEFKLMLSKVTVTTDSWMSSFNQAEFIEFCIYNASGEKIDNYVANSDESNFQILKDLHSAAKRDYYKVDETIKSLLDEIKSNNNIGLSDDDLPF